jgi:hypothetical protein
MRALAIVLGLVLVVVLAGTALAGTAPEKFGLTQRETAVQAVEEGRGGPVAVTTAQTAPEKFDLYYQGPVVVRETGRCPMMGQVTRPQARTYTTPAVQMMCCAEKWAQ